MIERRMSEYSSCGLFEFNQGHSAFAAATEEMTLENFRRILMQVSGVNSIIDRKEASF